MKEEKEKTIQDVISRRKQHTRRVDSKLIMKAYNYAYSYHGDQCRKSGEPYIIHPLNVAYILADIGLDDSTICAALLHDVVEDTEVTQEDITREFGKEISDMVAGVTKLSNIQFSSVEEQQVEDYRKMFLAMGKDIRVIIIKLADRLHNMRTLKYLKRDRQIANAKETMELYAPLANRLGLYSLKWELEDLGFKYLYPDDYKNIIIELEEKKKQKQELLEKTKEKIKQELKRQRITAIVKIETKHLYNIYKKINEKKIGMDEIKDLFAIKIITKQKQECYMILGIINTLYNLIPGTFKDYIATPRNNMYEAIHEIVLGEKGVELEVQICSYTMNKIAKYGIINYLPYIKKEEMNFKKNLSGIHYSLELKKILEDPKEFLATLKSELLEDEIYIFTPKGDIKVLPKGATAIDFAYSIHDEVGNHMIGCKINSIDMPLVTKLKNGNIVEIITSELKTVPEEEWIEVIKTAKAKNQILKLLQTKKEEEKKSIKIEILAFDRKNLALEITNVFMKNGINIKELQTEVTNNKAKINIVAEIRRMEQVDKLSEELMEIPNMIRVIK